MSCCAGSGEDCVFSCISTDEENDDGDDNIDNDGDNENVSSNRIIISDVYIYIYICMDTVQAMYIYVCVYTVYLYICMYIRGDNGGMVLMGNRLPTSSETNGIDFRRGRMSGMLSIVL